MSEEQRAAIILILDNWGRWIMSQPPIGPKEPTCNLGKQAIPTPYDVPEGMFNQIARQTPKPTFKEGLASKVDLLLARLKLSNWQYYRALYLYHAEMLSDVAAAERMNKDRRTVKKYREAGMDWIEERI